MIGFDEAVALISKMAVPLGTETVSIANASGRILAESVIAGVTAPAAAISAMDGYAIRNADISGISKSFLVIGKSFAGNGYSGTVEVDQAVRIFTGAPMPPGADRVVMQEDITREGNFATLTEEFGPGWHVRPAGSDFELGEELLPGGTKLGPNQLIAAAAADCAELTVWRKPRIVVLSTGDELVTPGTARNTAGSIPESVSFGVAALAERWGGEVMNKVRLTDDLDQLQEVAARAVEDADIVVVTGGASVGERDYAKAMFEPIGLDLIFSKVAIKPGKPVWAGRVGNTLIVGLPGNPTSAMVTARLILAPLIAGLAAARADTALQWETVRVGAPLAATGGREAFVRGTLRGGVIYPLNSKDFGAQKILASANCLLRCEAGMQAQPEGALVSVLTM